MGHFLDLREFLNRLEKNGKLYRCHSEINKDTELFPFYRIQMRGLRDSERKVFLFDNVFGAVGRKYEMSVLAGVYGASEEILSLGMSCAGYAEMLEKWHQALTHPIDPVLVDKGPVQEEVHLGDEIKELGLDELPVPVEEPGFSGVIRTGLPMITKDPETGIRNVGTYNGFFRAQDRLVAGIGFVHHALAYHWQTARRRNQGLPVAIVIGCNPEVMLSGSADIPYGVDELAVAGGIAASPVELVRCKTIPLEVPAHAEAVIEGIISNELLEPRLSFGENPGYMNLDDECFPVVHVTAVTHRKNAMFTPVLVGFPPSETNLIQGFCRSAQMYQRLKYEHRLPVEEVYFYQISGGKNFGLIRVSKDTPQSVVQEILAAAYKTRGGKYIIAVDYDVDLRDPELIIWALSFSSQPKEDISIFEGGSTGLDPSAYIRSSAVNEKDSAPRVRNKYSCVLINATRKAPYPPVALPRKEYMERALQMWKAQGDLPVPQLRKPWFGYNLGHWNDTLEEYAQLITKGKYKEVGEKAIHLQKKLG